MIDTPSAFLHHAERDAFCTTCPQIEEVTAFLHQEGFSLVRSIDPLIIRRRNKPPTILLPAQYHYRDAHETDVIYLAGKDTPEGSGCKFPAHASRWWLVAGTNNAASARIAHALAARWQLRWQRAKAASHPNP